jgi:hypothetical protein
VDPCTCKNSTTISRNLGCRIEKKHEQDYARKAQASELTLAGWSRKGGLGLATRVLNAVELVAKHATIRPAELAYKGPESGKLWGRGLWTLELLVPGNVIIRKAPKAIH